jgi:hypothetical protein
MYSVANVDMVVSREQAIVAAREQAIVAAGPVSLEFPSDQPIIAQLRTSTRDGGLILYPYWFVELPLIYPADLSMYAWQLCIWADTGELASSYPVGAYGAVSSAGVVDGSSSLQNVPSDTNMSPGDENTGLSSQSKNLLTIAAIIIAIAIVGLIAVVFKKR